MWAPLSVGLWLQLDFELNSAGDAPLVNSVIVLISQLNESLCLSPAE